MNDAGDNATVEFESGSGGDGGDGKQARLTDPLGRVPVVSTDAVPGLRSVRPCGVVIGTAIAGTNILNDLTPRERSRHRRWSCPRLRVGLFGTTALAVGDLCRAAETAGADAGVELTLDVEMGGERAGMMVAIAMGTAVVTGRTC